MHNTDIELGEVCKHINYGEVRVVGKLMPPLLHPAMVDAWYIIVVPRGMEDTKLHWRYDELAVRYDTFDKVHRATTCLGVVYHIDPLALPCNPHYKGLLAYVVHRKHLKVRRYV